MFLAMYTVEQQNGHLEVPENWKDLPEFINWFVASRMPLMVPWDAEVVVVDIATSISLFRKGQYQVELYLVHPGKVIPVHSHPQVEVVTMLLGGGKVCGDPHPQLNTGLNVGRCLLTEAGKVHGGPTSARSGGYAMLSFERWIDEKPSSAAFSWDGETSGSIHDELIATHRP